jgi:hypothetical protein
MKVTANVSFLLCIISLVMPVAVDARANRFLGLKKRSATTMRSIEEREEVSDFAATQESHRALKSPATKLTFQKHEKAYDFAIN